MKKLMLSQLKQTNTLPKKQDFVAVWRTEYGLFSEAFNYNEEEDQLYVYSEPDDEFLPECDHGFSGHFFKKMEGKITFFVEVQDEKSN